MHLTNGQPIFLVANYLRTGSFKEVQQLFEQHFRNRVSPTKMSFWKNVKKYKTVGSSLYRNKDRSGSVNLLKEKPLSRI